MGLLIDGVWHIEDPPPASDGRFRRTASSLRNWVTRDGEAGPSGRSGFRAEPGRYHLYVAMTCPWAHRTVIFRALKQLEEVISLSYVAPRRTDQGWVFAEDDRDPVANADALHEIYTRSEPDFSGRATVPVLWDRATSRIVSNESADIIRMLNAAFTGCVPETQNYRPADLVPSIDAWNERIYENVNNGVYRAGFATTQAAYDEAVQAVFETLDAAEEQLGKTRYLLGDRQTEADWHLFPTLVRFDVAYHGAFKCNVRRIVDYPNLWPYTRDLYQTKGIAETIDLDTVKRGYYSISPLRNPTGIVPAGPRIDFSEPHGRA